MKGSFTCRCCADHDARAPRPPHDGRGRGRRRRTGGDRANGAAPSELTGPPSRRQVRDGAPATPLRSRRAGGAAARAAPASHERRPAPRPTAAAGRSGQAPAAAAARRLDRDVKLRSAGQARRRDPRRPHDARRAPRRAALSDHQVRSWPSASAPSSCSCSTTRSWTFLARARTRRVRRSPRARLPANSDFIITGPLDGFATRIKVVGLRRPRSSPCPIVLWQLWRFVTPGLHPQGEEVRHPVHRCRRWRCSSSARCIAYFTLPLRPRLPDQLLGQPVTAAVHAQQVRQPRRADDAGLRHRLPVPRAARVPAARRACSRPKQLLELAALRDRRDRGRRRRHHAER